jgi:hypothetical protein
VKAPLVANKFVLVLFAAEAFVVKRLVAVTPVVDALMMLASVEKSVVIVPTVVDAVLSTVCPDTVSVVAVVVAKVDVPVTAKVPVATKLVVEKLEEDALVRVVCPVAVRVVVTRPFRKVLRPEND